MDFALLKHVSPLAHKISTQFLWLHPCFLGSDFQLDKGEYCATKPEVEKMAIYELQLHICTVLLVDQTLVYIWTSLPENQSNSLAFAEHFVLSASSLVAHHSHKFQWNAGPQKNVGIAIGFPLISCLRARRHAIEVEVAIFNFSTSGLVS